MQVCRVQIDLLFLKLCVLFNSFFMTTFLNFAIVSYIVHGNYLTFYYIALVESAQGRVQSVGAPKPMFPCINNTFPSNNQV